MCVESRTGMNNHIVRMLEYIDGEVLQSKHITPTLLYKGGALLGEMHRLLEVGSSIKIKYI